MFGETFIYFIVSAVLLIRMRGVNISVSGVLLILLISVMEYSIKLMQYLIVFVVSVNEQAFSVKIHHPLACSTKLDWFEGRDLLLFVISL